MEQLLIGSLAAVIASVCLFAAATEWQAAYELRSMRLIQERFGRAAARLAFLVLAAILLVSATMIWMGIRPAYAAAERRVPAIDIG